MQKKRQVIALPLNTIAPAVTTSEDTLPPPCPARLTTSIPVAVHTAHRARSTRKTTRGQWCLCGAPEFSFAAFPTFVSPPRLTHVLKVPEVVVRAAHSFAIPFTTSLSLLPNATCPPWPSPQRPELGLSQLTEPGLPRTYPFATLAASSQLSAPP